MLPFWGFGNRRGDPWSFVGLASSFPDVEMDGNSLVGKRPCGKSGSDSGGSVVAGCKVFRIPRPADAAGHGGGEDAEEIEPEESGTAAHLQSMKDQVLVFKYKGKFHAVDNVGFPKIPFPFSSLRSIHFSQPPTLYSQEEPD